MIEEMALDELRAGCVCDDCNHFFSRELELALGRDSAEAFLRIECGGKPPTPAKKHGG